MRKYLRGSIKLVLTIAVCLLFVAVTFSNVIVKSADIQRTQTSNDTNPVSPNNQRPLGLFNFRILNLDWNYWDNKPNLFLMATGNVGIGTSNPQAKLDIVGNIAINGKEIINETGNWVGNLSSMQGPAGPQGEPGLPPAHEWLNTMLRFKNPDGTWGNYTDLQGPQGEQGEQGPPGAPGESNWVLNGSNIYNTNTGNVGIGTTSPTAPLDVVGNVKTSGDYKYTSPKTYYLNIPAADFNSFCEAQENWINTGDYIYLTPPNTIIQLRCPVHLPEGATVTEFQTYLYDNNTTSDITLSISLKGRYIYSTSIFNMALLTVNTAGSSTSIQAFTDTTIENPTIDNENNQYWIFATYNPHSYYGLSRFYGCRIAYTINTIAP